MAITLDLQVNHVNGDALRCKGTIDTYDRTSTLNRAGAGGATAHKYGSGVRFINVTIPQGAKILTAYLTFTCSVSGSGAGCLTRISAEDADNPPLFPATAAEFDARYDNHTTAVVDWDDIPDWTLDTEYNSPEIKTVIQEIIDREGWSSGNKIALFWEDFDDRSSQSPRKAYSYDSSSAKAPRLHIEYIYIPTVQTNAATGITADLATLHGQLTDDGGEPCQVRFQYGLTVAYGANTAWQSGKETGNLVEQLIQDLDDAITYHFRAQAQNDAGRSPGDDATFDTLKAQVALDGRYITETPPINTAYVIGRDSDGNPVYGTSKDQTEIDLVGQRLDFTQELSIPTEDEAEDVAEAMLEKARLSNSRGFILANPHCGVELWDVIAVNDTLCAQAKTRYRITAISFDYEPRRDKYQHKLFIGAR